MKFSVHVPTMAQELRLLNQIVRDKPTVPIDANVMIQAGGDGIRLTTTNREIQIDTICRAAVVDPGLTTVGASRLLDIFERLPPDSPAVIEKESETRVRVEAGNFLSRLQTLPADDFGLLQPSAEAGTPLDMVALRAMIKRVRYAINEKGVSAYMLNGALLRMQDKVAAMVATDGKRLAMATIPGIGLDTSMLIPSETLDAICNTFGEGEIRFLAGEKNLYFQNSHRSLISRTIAGQFPEYGRIIPRENQYKAIINRAGFSEVLNRVGLVAEDSGGIWLTFDPKGFVLLQARRTEGEAAEHLPMAYDGPTLRVCCHWEYLLDFLGVAANPNIEIAVQDSEKPLLLTDGDSHLAVIMLMRA